MNQNVYTRQPATGIPNVIFVLLVSNGLLFAVQQVYPHLMLYFFALWPFGDEYRVAYEQFVEYWPRVGAPFEPWQLLTYGFQHGDLTHIAFNMFGLWMFGQDLERLWGPRRFLAYYLVCVVGAGLVQLLVAGLQGGIYPTVGASGGLFGLLLAYGLTYPNRIVMPIFPPIPMRAITFVIVFGLLELYLGLSGGAPGIANFAHVGGMLFGFLTLRYWARRRRR